MSDPRGVNHHWTPMACDAGNCGMDFLIPWENRKTTARKCWKHLPGYLRDDRKGELRRGLLSHGDPYATTGPS